MKGKKNWLLGIGICLIICGTAFAEEPVYPAYSGFVNDFAGVIDSATKEKLEGLCRVLEKKTSAELAIAVVKSVAPLDSKTYAVKLFEKWKIGKKGKDNGILMLLAMDERRVEIEVGYGLEGVITDARVGEILDRYVVPYFKEGKFGEGLYNGAAAIAQKIAQAASQELGEGYKAEEQAKEEAKVEWPGWLMPAIVGSIIVLVILSIFFSGIASGLFGAIMGAVIGASFAGLVGVILGAIIGFVLSYVKLPGGFSGGMWGGGWGGGFGGGGGGGGFGGGSSGGGGAGRSW